MSSYFAQIQDIYSRYKDGCFLVSVSPCHFLRLGEGERERVAWTLYLCWQTSQHYIVSQVFMAFQSLSYKSISFRTLTYICGNNHLARNTLHFIIPFVPHFCYIWPGTQQSFIVLSDHHLTLVQLLTWYLLKFLKYCIMATIYVTKHTYCVLLIRNKMKDNRPFCVQLLNGMEVTDIFKSFEVSKNLSFLKNT